ncbi:unnamed protein product [Mytilus coruscus]|uniref:Tyr recombinase domain-containing protein n=1 Tax=Mytilus coruscus TaxID=42192 RepID=A0A6J8A5R3_MYTCO|nr:unnamed protein product [Mytilus coruscus]
MLIVTFKWTKTIQFGERKLEIPFIINSESKLCPYSAYMAMCKHFQAPLSSSAFLMRGSRKGEFKPVRYRVFNNFLKTCINSIELNSEHYSTHSFRRGGATWAFKCCFPSNLIQLQGDWKSSAYKRYLKYGLSDKLIVVNRQKAWNRSTLIIGDSIVKYFPELKNTTIQAFGGLTSERLVRKLSRSDLNVQDFCNFLLPLCFILFGYFCIERKIETEVHTPVLVNITTTTEICCPGFYKKRHRKCKRCPKGTYGLDCLKICECTGFKKCDRRTGDCKKCIERPCEDDDGGDDDDYDDRSAVSITKNSVITDVSVPVQTTTNSENKNVLSTVRTCDVCKEFGNCSSEQECSVFSDLHGSRKTDKWTIIIIVLSISVIGNVIAFVLGFRWYQRKRQRKQSQTAPVLQLTNEVNNGGEANQNSMAKITWLGIAMNNCK